MVVFAALEVFELLETAIARPLTTKTASPFLFPRHARRWGDRLTRHFRSGSAATPISYLTEDYLHRLVADLFVWHIHAASRWADYVRRDWAHYLNARSNTNQRQLDDR